MLNIVWDLITNKFRFSDSNNDKICIDGANPSFLRRSLKMLIGERSDYETVIEQAKKTRWNWKNSMRMLVPCVLLCELECSEFFMKSC